MRNGLDLKTETDTEVDLTEDLLRSGDSRPRVVNGSGSPLELTTVPVLGFITLGGALTGGIVFAPTDLVRTDAVPTIFRSVGRRSKLRVRTSSRDRLLSRFACASS